MTKTQYVNDDNFKSDVLESTTPVLVDFTAAWCGPCKMLDPVLNQVAVDWDGKVKIVKLDVDKNPQLATQYQVLGVPTLMLFVDGEPSQRTTGYLPKDRLLEKFNPYI